MTARDKNKGIELEIDQVGQLEKEFISLPNALLRGERSKILGLDFTGMTLRARCMLAALLSMKDGHRCSRERIEALAPELKRDGIDTVLKELRVRGHLRQVRVNADGGKFFWRWSISLRPIFAAQAMPGKSGDGLETDKGDETIHGSAVDGSAVHGSAVHGSAGAIRSTRGLEVPVVLEEPPPPTPPPSLGQAEPAKPPEEEAVRILDEAQTIGRAGRRRIPPGRRLTALARRLAPVLAAGWTHSDVVYQLGQPLDTADSVYAVLCSRIGDLIEAAPPPPRAAQSPAQVVRWTVPWCGTCWHASRRIACDDEGRPTGEPCPACGAEDHRLTSVA